MMTDDSARPPEIPVVVGGATITTRIWEPGTTARGDVVLCHGTPWSSQVWNQVSVALCHDYRVFVWDMPGYGASEKGATVAKDLRTQMRRLAGLVDHWQLECPHMVAHDIGGAVALGAHLLHGVEYADLFLWDTVTLVPWGSPFFRLVADHPDVFARLPPRLHAALVHEYIAGAVTQRRSDEDMAALALPWLDEQGQQAFYAQIAALSPADTVPIVERLGSIRCPTRIGWGARDPWLPLHQAYELQSRIGHTDVTVLTEVGHLAPYEAPAAVAAALRGWFSTAPTSSAASRDGGRIIESC